METNLISRQKSDLRSSMRSLIKGWTAQNDLGSASEKACSKIISLSQYKSSEIVLAYIPLKNEADCFFVIEDALSKGKTVAVPKCLPEETKMDFYILRTDMPLKSQLKSGSYGILEPKEDLLKKLELFPVSNIFAVLPGLAFSKSGKRLGKGKGFYDRFFGSLMQRGFKKLFLCGLCLPCMIKDDIPCDDFDIKADYVAY